MHIPVGSINDAFAVNSVYVFYVNWFVAMNVYLFCANIHKNGAHETQWQAPQTV